jgi:uncharacterized membrane protein YtjA (UPF0391 family)
MVHTNVHDFHGFPVSPDVFVPERLLCAGIDRAARIPHEKGRRTSRRPETPEREENMLGWAILFFILAIVAAILGFGGIAGIAATIGKVLLVVFLIAFVIALIAGRRRPVV